MRGEQKFLFCKHCGNLVGFVDNKGVPLSCCGDRMTELVPNSVDASTEKHVPVVSAATNKVEVTIGSAAHPMEDTHHIVFVYLETERGGQRKNLNAGEAPSVTFTFTDDKPVAVFAWCNQHGLWKASI